MPSELSLYLVGLNLFLGDPVGLAMAVVVRYTRETGRTSRHAHLLDLAESPVFGLVELCRACLGE